MRQRELGSEGRLMVSRSQLCGSLLVLGVLAILMLACGSDEGTEPALTVTPPESTRDLARETAAPLAVQTPFPGDKWELWVGGTHLRGANIYQRRTYPELDGPEFMGDGPVGPPYTQDDLYRMAAMGANYVNVSHPGLFTEEPPFSLDPQVQANLDNLLDMIARADMFAVISFRTGPGRSEFTFFWDEVGDWFDEGYLNDSIWQDQSAQDAWVEMWRHTADRYRQHPIVVGYDLMVEPNANEVGSHALDDALEIWEPEAFYAEYEGTLYDWNQLYPRLTEAIRQVDGDTPILVGGMGYSSVEWLPYLQPSDDPRTVYVMHQYAPHQYTHQHWDEIECTYPGTCDLYWDGKADDQLDSRWLDALHESAREFAVAFGVPLAANEFGVVRWVPGAAAFMGDQMEMLEQLGANYALWVWDPAWKPWAEEVNAFNFRFGPDPSNHSDVAQAELQEVIRSFWRRNGIRPSSLSSLSTPAPMPLQDVGYWAYQIQDLSTPGAVDALADSHYDMLVVEPTRTDWSSEDRYFDTASMVARLKSSLASDGVRRKLVLAYVDIGEAEDWRWYWTWSQGWDCSGAPPSDWPEYILACDPDGWAGNYPVAYWDPAWKDLLIYGANQAAEQGGDYESVIDQVVIDGFDGIYLDWVEAYEDPDVIEAAQAAGLDPAEEMVALIREIRQYATTRIPEFLVVQQNAAALITDHPESLDVVDAIVQEAVWFDGDATDDWDDPDGYDWENDEDLTNYYLDYLAQYSEAGVPVFVCEYALARADEAYASSNAAGFIPYVTRRSLSRLTTTVPPGY